MTFPVGYLPSLLLMSPVDARALGLASVSPIRMVPGGWSISREVIFLTMSGHTREVPVVMTNQLVTVFLDIGFSGPAQPGRIDSRMDETPMILQGPSGELSGSWPVRKPGPAVWLPTQETGPSDFPVVTLLKDEVSVSLGKLPVITGPVSTPVVFIPGQPVSWLPAWDEATIRWESPNPVSDGILVEQTWITEAIIRKARWSGKPVFLRAGQKLTPAAADLVRSLGVKVVKQDS